MIRRTAITELIIPDLETSAKIMAKIIVKSIIKQARDEKAKRDSGGGNRGMDSNKRTDPPRLLHKQPELTATEKFILNHSINL